MRKLKLGFVGAGRIAATQMRTFSQRDDVQIVAAADPDAAMLQQQMKRYDIPSGYADYKAMLRAESLDAISICTPNTLHAAPAVAAMRAGLDVLVEKPMAKDATEAKRMVRVASETGRKLVIGFQYRFNPRTEFLRRAFDEGQFGRVLYANVKALRRRGIPNWGVFGRKELQGGGPLIDIGVHMLEAAHYAMGAPQPVSACADLFTYIGDQPSDRIESMWKGWDYKTYNVEDLAVGRVRFDNGAVLHIESSFAAHIEKDDWNFKLMGEHAGATWEPAQIFRDEAGYMVNKTPGWLPPKTTWQDMFDAKLHHFVDHVLHDAPTKAPGQDGLAVQQMLDALYRSGAQGGREIRIKAK